MGLGEGLSWIGLAGLGWEEVALHAYAGFWCFESENFNSFFPSLCRGVVVVSFTAGCGERERGGSVQRHLLAIIPFGGRVKGHCAAICFARPQHPGLGVSRRRCDFAELSADRDGEMWLSSGIYSAIRVLVNSSEIRDTHPPW